MSDFESPTHELVASAHGNAARVRELLDAHPELVDARYGPWNESPLEAAAHTGGREIAALLLERGAAPNHVGWAMLGRAADLRILLTGDPTLAHTPGAHGIGLLYHAALSGDVDTLEAAWDAGARDGLNAAIRSHSVPALEWLLLRGAARDAVNMRGQTPLDAARAAPWDEGVARLSRSDPR